jgi:GNAT superfamily N-acetyltransferase
MPANHADFYGITYKYYNTHPTSHEIEAVHPKTGESISYLRWNRNSGNIEDISVDKEHRRKGVATGMYRHAVALANSTGIVAPVHSAVKTAEGAAWAKSVEK